MRKVEITVSAPRPIRKIIVGSLLPEAGRSVPKTQVNISENNAGIQLVIEAETTNSLRAALNSYLRWLNCVVSITTSVDEELEH
jgi:tRNA threonylcarbamoyladenosine modification (KEOPS) complex  Pcc1 subunit